MCKIVAQNFVLQPGEADDEAVLRIDLKHGFGCTNDLSGGREQFLKLAIRRGIWRDKADWTLGQTVLHASSPSPKIAIAGVERHSNLDR
jgi:hypothetical protein